MIDLDAQVFADLMSWFKEEYRFGPDQPGTASWQLYELYMDDWKSDGMTEHRFPSPKVFEEALLILESLDVLTTRKLTAQELEDTNGPWTLMVENAKVSSK